MDTNGKQIVTDKVFTDCTLYCVHYVSLPHKTELAKFENRVVVSLFNYGLSLNRRDYFNILIKTIWVLFLLVKISHN